VSIFSICDLLTHLAKVGDGTNFNRHMRTSFAKDELGTMENPILVRSAGDEQYAGCTGSPAGSHVVTWLGVS
jgi:hypothetical protein